MDRTSTRASRTARTALTTGAALVTTLATAAAVTVSGPASARAADTHSYVTPAHGCTRYADASGDDRAAGTAAAPVRSASRLVSILSTGQVGCLGAGDVFAGDVTISRSGITLRSIPGGRATVRGRVVVAGTAADARLVNLVLDGTHPTSLASSVTVDGDRAVLLGNDISNSNTRICVSVGFSRVTTGVVLKGNRIHHCGADPQQDHGVYLEQARATTVTQNFIFANAGRGVQMFYDADGSRIAHNVISRNGVGVHFGGQLKSGVRRAAEGNLVTSNIISNSTLRGAGTRYNVDSWYDQVLPVPRSLNTLSANCLFHAAAPTRNFNYDGNPGFSVDASNAVQADPAFSNEAAADFRLLAGSRCKGKGVVPSVQSQPALPATRSAATLRGLVTPHWTTTSISFQWGTSTAYGRSTSVVGAGNGTLPVLMSARISGLLPGTTYHYRLVATNSFGTVVSADRTFTTAP